MIVVLKIFTTESRRALSSGKDSDALQREFTVICRSNTIKRRGGLWVLRIRAAIMLSACGSRTRPVQCRFSFRSRVTHLKQF